MPDISVRVEVAHSYRGDLRVALIAPSGVTSDIRDGTPDLSRTYTTSNNADLATLAQGRPSIQGRWQLHVSDNFRRDNGLLTTWSLELRTV